MNFFLVKNYYFYILDRFDVLNLKIIFLKIKKYHFNAFRNEKHFKKQSQLHSQTDSKSKREFLNNQHLP